MSGVVSWWQPPEAFINIYKRRVADLLRIASNGTGILPQGEQHPDLTNRLADEASKAAKHVLTMCIRALDYCPPVDITFGEYLRAIVTADADIVQDDDLNYRLAFIDAFRHRGIYPEGIKMLSEESLRYACGPVDPRDTEKLFGKETLKLLREYRNQISYKKSRKDIYHISRDFIRGTRHSDGLHKHLYYRSDDSIEFEKITGLVFNNDWPEFGVRTTSPYESHITGPSFSVQNLRVVSRTGPDGNQINYIIFTMMQRAGAIIQDNTVSGTYIPDVQSHSAENRIELRGGCTLIFDLDSLELMYSIAKPILDPDHLKKNIRELNKQRIINQYNYQMDSGLRTINEESLYLNADPVNSFNEPFSFLHSH